MSMKERSFDLRHILVLAMAVGLVISLVPIVWAGFYACPVMDDLGYGSYAHHAVAQGQGILGALAGAWKTVQQYYVSWQGTFSAIFLFSLQPGVFSVHLYGLTTILMLACLLGSQWFLLQTLVERHLGGTRLTTLLIYLPLVGLQIQYVYDINQAFYWFNGSSYYTIFYALACVLSGVLLRLYHASSPRSTGVLCALGGILAVIIGGGNYTTALFCAELLVLGCVWVFVYRRKKLPLFLVITGILLVAFAINALAPGNATRAASSQGMGPLSAIFSSLYTAAGCVVVWTKLPQLVYAMLLVPLCLGLVRNMGGRFAFRFPLVALGLAFGLFASQLTPPFYAMSHMGYERQVNIYYYSYYLLVAFGVFYLCGWVHRVYGSTKLASLYAHFDRVERVAVVGCTIWMALVCVLGTDFSQTTSYQTAAGLWNGSVQTYKEEYLDICRTFQQHQGEAVQVKDISTLPPFFEPLSIQSDPAHWINVQIAQYYGVEQVSLPSE